MRHFRFLSTAAERDVFHQLPQPFDGRTDDRALLSYAVGATLYTPATRPGFAKELAGRAGTGLTSTVLCLEDAIADADLAWAEENVVSGLAETADLLAERPGLELPLVFIRVRSPEMLSKVAARLGRGVTALNGFVLPKFCAANAEAYLDALDAAAAAAPHPLYAMPVLETAGLLHCGTRVAELEALREVLTRRAATVLNVRVGGTDLSGLLGLRRSDGLTIYDLAPLRDLVSDVVNTFARADVDHVVSAPVWEYFARDDRVFKPLLRESPFSELGREGLELRRELIDRHLDGLIREVLLDRANGLTGKTVIHPSHVRAVNALFVVSHEEYVDATAIVAAEGGVLRSAYGNKMNEVGPHRLWAQRVLRRAHVFGVYEPERSFIDLLEA